MDQEILDEIKSECILTNIQDRRIYTPRRLNSGR